jgi:hypothetical protein
MSIEVDRHRTAIEPGHDQRVALTEHRERLGERLAIGNDARDLLGINLGAPGGSKGGLPIWPSVLTLA